MESIDRYNCRPVFCWAHRGEVYLEPALAGSQSYMRIFMLTSARDEKGQTISGDNRAHSSPSRQRRLIAIL